MRISDWSSDVCSSDLQSRFEHADRGGRRQRAFDVGLQCQRAIATGAELPVALMILGDDVDLREEIPHPQIVRDTARASCRARVCQYVYISVVTQSLQQKKNPYHTKIQQQHIKA